MKATHFLPASALLALAQPAIAQSDAGGGLSSLAGAAGFGNRGLVQIVASLINQAMGLLGVIVVCLVIYAGFLWMTAAGNEEKITKAKAILSGAVIGLVIIMSAYSIAQFVVGGIANATR